MSRTEGQAKMVKRLGSKAQVNWGQVFCAGPVEWGGEGKNHFSLSKDSYGQREPQSRTAVT